MLHSLFFWQPVPKSNGPRSDKSSRTLSNASPSVSYTHQLQGIQHTHSEANPSKYEVNAGDQDNPLHASDMGGSKSSRRKKAAPNPLVANDTVTEAPDTPASQKGSPQSQSRQVKPHISHEKFYVKDTKATAFSLVGRLLVVWLARLLAWYTIFTVLFRCPTIPDPSSPTICHGYSTAHQVVTPYLQPYYQAYASPYVERLTPFISHANEAYFYPAFEAASARYEMYAQPPLQKVKSIIEKKYKEKLQPHVSKATTRLNQFYDKHLAAHSDKALKFCHDAASSPYWAQARGHAEGIYNVYLVPAYKQVTPYVHRVYENGKYVAVVVLGPHFKDGIKVSSEWLEKNVFSGISDIWKEYVEVQVERIRERLTSGSSSRENSSFSHAQPDLDHSNYPEEVEPEILLKQETPEMQAARAAARKQIEEDLATYTEKFGKHADEAITSLNAHIEKIAASAMESNKKNVEEQMKKLDKLIDNEFRGLKATIMNLAKYYKPDHSAEETSKNKLEAFDKLFEATGKVGTLIKDTVQEMRWDSQKFLASVHDEVAAEVDTHVEKVDALIDSGIQELGMKWAWEAEGVTYKDWARYQDLKKEFSGIRARVIQASEKNKDLIEVTNWAEGDFWEGGAVAKAKAAAAELARVKRVAKKKIELNDYSEDFSDKYLFGASPADLNQGESENPKVLTKEVDTTGEIRSQLEVVGKADAAVVGEQQINYEDDGVFEDTLTNKIGDSLEDTKEHISRAVSEAIYGTKTTQPVGDSITSIASDLYNSAYNAASRALYGTPQPQGEALFRIATDKYSAAVAAASSIIYATPAPEPWSERAYHEYQEAVKKAANAYQQVIHDLDAAVHGEPQPAHESIMSAASAQYSAALELAQEKYSLILDSASSAVYGTAQPTHESIMSVASEKYTAAVSAGQQGYSSLVSRASAAVIGTSTGSVESVASVVSEKLSDAQEVVSENIYGTPQPIAESIASRAGKHDQAQTVKNVAEEKYDTASSVVASLMTSPPAVESILSSANQNLQDIVDVASQQVYGREKGTIEKATSAVEEAYASAQSKVSDAIYGRETGAVDAALNKISEVAKSASAEISIAVYGTPKGPMERATSAIAESVDAATSIIDEKYQNAKAAVSDALYGKEEKYYASVVESAQVRLTEAVESASAKLRKLYEDSKAVSQEKVENVVDGAKNVAEEVSEAMSSATEKVKEKYQEIKDEL
ncbi:hypothetical protein BDZ91DRAFT_724797 [Kalaharituber pfeilii]|nr:hypothetical protein BDZ91DRAFT_724797 [Kalaharituber pfeilii]